MARFVQNDRTRLSLSCSATLDAALGLGPSAVSFQRMDMAKVFGVFSRRVASRTPPPKPLTNEFRNRVLIRLRDALGDSYNADLFWGEVHKKLQYLHGRPRLFQGATTTSPMMDAIAFLMDCSDGHFLDFIELALEHWRFNSSEQVVTDFNQFLRVDDLPYAVTDYVWTETFEPVPSLGGAPRKGTRLTAYPQVIVRGSQATHALAVEPALTLLKRTEFKTANAEFLEALADYRKGDHGDCLTKCGSAFESVLKIVCDRNGWPFDQKDTASVLLSTVFSHKPSLEPFLKEPLTIVATLRNRLSTAHGAGTTPKTVSSNRAEYTINATAAAILLLVSECA